MKQGQALFCREVKDRITNVKMASPINIAHVLAKRNLMSLVRHNKCVNKRTEAVHIKLRRAAKALTRLCSLAKDFTALDRI